MTINVNDCFFYIKNGANIKQGVISGGIPITRIETLANDTFNRDKMGYAGIHDKKKYTEYILQDGDILMSHINSMAYLGRAVMYKMQKNECIIHGMNLLRLKANRNFILPEYAEYYFKSNTFKKYIKKIAKKSVNQASFSIADLKSIPLFLPNMVEQKKIYNTLNRIDNIISLKNQQLKKLDLLTKSLFVEMFGDKAHILTMNDLCNIITDGTHQSPKFVSDGIPFLFVSNVSENKISYDTGKFISIDTYKELYKRTPIEKYDILLSTVGSYGHPAIVKSNKKFLFQRHIAYLKPKKELINSIYLHAAILSDEVQRQIESKVKGIAQKTLNLSEIKTLKIPLPSMTEQNIFATIVEKIDKHKLLIID